jgi:uncharacterized protein YbjT (DUF2867 family)
MTYLITGATGNIGARVAELLLTEGERPRVFVRDADKARARFGDRVDIHCGDLADAESMRAAFHGVDRVLLINAGPTLAARDKLAALVAVTTGVQHLVKLSTLDVEHNVGTGPWHAQGEAAIAASGIGFTFVRPAGFMDNALAWAPQIKPDGIIRAATGDGKITFIHSDDIAEVAAAALTSTKYEGECLPITGPEALSYAEMVATIGASIGKALSFLPISDDEERQRLIEQGESPESVDYHLSIFRAIERGSLATVTDTVARILGRSPITFEQWAKEHVAAFQTVPGHQTVVPLGASDAKRPRSH